MFKKFIITFFVIFLSASVWAMDQENDTSGEMAKDNILLLPEAGYGMVYVVRPFERQGNTRLYVYVDETNKDNIIGYTVGGQHINFQVTPGEHIIYSVGENTKYLKIHIQEGETLFVKQRILIDPRGGSNQDTLERVPAAAGTLLIDNTTKGFLYEKENGDKVLK